jgi:methyltransferase-like protein
MTDEQIQNAIKELNEKKQMIGANGTTNSSLSENSIKAIQQVLARDYSMHLSVEQIKKMSRTNLNRLYNDVVNGVMPTDKELLEYLTPEEQIQNTRDLNLVKNDEGTPNKVIDNKVIDKGHTCPQAPYSPT